MDGAQASLTIDGTETRLAGGAVDFQATYATQGLGALPYMSTGESLSTKGMQSRQSSL